MLSGRCLQKTHPTALWLCHRQGVHCLEVCLVCSMNHSSSSSVYSEVFKYPLLPPSSPHHLHPHSTHICTSTSIVIRLLYNKSLSTSKLSASSSQTLNSTLKYHSTMPSLYYPSQALETYRPLPSSCAMDSSPIEHFPHSPQSLSGHRHSRLRRPNYYSNASMYVCCGCGDGPKVWDNNPVCVICHHVACGDCELVK